MKRTITVIIFLLCIIGLNAQSQKTSVISEYFSNAIGFRYSDISGYGLSYQRFFLKDYAVKLSVFFYYYEFMRGDGPDYEEEEKNTRYNLGIELQRTIIHHDNIRVFAFAGGFYDNQEEKEVENGLVSIDESTESVTGGLGCGIEYILQKHFILHLECGYKFKNEEGDEYNQEEKVFKPTTLKETTLGFGIGASYSF